MGGDCRVLMFVKFFIKAGLKVKQYYFILKILISGKYNEQGKKNMKKKDLTEFVSLLM